MARLEVRDLKISLPGPDGPVEALRGVDLSLDPGERLGLVGETGSGAPLLARALLGLVDEPGRITQGQIRFDRRSLLALPSRELRRVRAKRISAIPRDPGAAFAPTLSLGRQMAETLAAHEGLSARRARERALAALRAVGMPAPEDAMDAYPPALSSAHCQRAAIALALLTEPEILVADEPTAALGPTGRAEVMGLLLRLCRERGMGLVLATRDLALAAEATERLMVLYAGRVVEEGPTRALIEAPRHPYTEALIAAMPGRGARGARLREIEGAAPAPSTVPGGCAFHPRCPRAYAGCYLELPELEADAADETRRVACLRPIPAPAAAKGAA